MKPLQISRRDQLESMEKSDLVDALILAQLQLDNERRIPLGRYAFYHRHLAMGYVRRKNRELADWASSEAGHQIDAEGGKSFEDVVARLEKTLGDLVDMFFGYSIETHEVGSCTIPDHERWRIDQARRALNDDA